MITFTKNSISNEYDVIGPVAELREGASVVVHTRSGKKKRVICGKPGKSFVAKFGPHQGELVAIAPIHKERAAENSDNMCWECRTRVAVVKKRDSSGILGNVCRQCARLPSYELSFM